MTGRGRYGRGNSRDTFPQGLEEGLGALPKLLLSWGSPSAIEWGGLPNPTESTMRGVGLPPHSLVSRCVPNVRVGSPNGLGLCWSLTMGTPRPIVNRWGGRLVVVHDVGPGGRSGVPGWGGDSR